jgi:hypothetical protein
MSFPSNCGSRFVAVDASCGCALTRASITGMTPDLFEAQSSKEVYMDRVITNAQEAVIAGYQEKFLESLLNSRMVGIGSQLGRTRVGNESIILPYIYRRQKRVINSNYWTVVSGSATPGAGSNGLHPGAWDLVVTNNTSRYGTTLTAIERYFLPGRNILVEHVNGSTKAAYASQFKVVRAVNSDSGGSYRATITLEPNYSENAWGAASSAIKLPWQPTAGLVLNLANSVSDYESWCNNDASENNNKLLTFWLQTTRETHCVNSEYLKAMSAALTSGYWKEFRMLPIAEQRRQQQAQAYKAWLNSVFFGQRINELQDVNSYTSLPTVRDPLNTDCILEYKANALGFEQQLIDCGRYADEQGTALDLLDLFELSYDLKRAREASGGSIDRIEWATNRTNAGRIFTTMLNFFKSYYGTEITRYFQPNQKLTFDKQVMLNYDVYEIPAEFGGFELVIWHDDYFSDKILAAGSDADQKNRQRVMWALDWSDIQVGIAGSASVQRKNPHPDVDSLYKCVIKNTENTYLLKSRTWTSIIEDPLRHYVIKNFNGDCPVINATPCTGGA